jgi:hypothetical protein
LVAVVVVVVVVRFVRSSSVSLAPVGTRCEDDE